jgi:hypothetical protein
LKPFSCPEKLELARAGLDHFSKFRQTRNFLDDLETAGSSKLVND